MIASADQFFKPGLPVTYHIFSDQDCSEHGVWHCVSDAPWPAPTLYRYLWFRDAAVSLSKHQYVFYCDVDTLFVGDVDDSILSAGLTAVIHQGFASKPRSELPYEWRGESTAYVPDDQGTDYYAGGFQGGRTQQFLQVAANLRERIDLDTDNGILAEWHDESHWNRHLVEFPPSVTLPGTFLCGETNRHPDAKILCLDKNHELMRE